MRLKDVTIEEARKFLSTRPPADTKYYDIDADREIRTAEFISGVWMEGELVGVGGVALSYWLFHHTFYMVCEKARGKGYGKQLQKANFDYIRANGVPFLVQTIVKGNEAAKTLHEHGGSKIIYETKDSYHLVKVFNTWGKIVSPFIPLMLRVFYSPIGRAVAKYKSNPSLGF